ncbi:hypothetical protein [Haloferax sp. DFSO52]|uniref:hypothetical protein n=1 Tax=Haloferax sp. DFSO52 TaxID=3388505 RepID=UPI003A8354A5
MPGIYERFTDGWERALDALTLTVVPILFACTEVSKIQSVLAHDGVHIGFTFGLPMSVGTVWQFVNPPNSGVNVYLGVPVGRRPSVLVPVFALLVVKAALAAGYFGSIKSQLTTGEYDFVASVRSHFAPFFVLTVVPFAVLLPFEVGIGRNATDLPTDLVALVALLIVLFFITVYLLYATPYLLVLRDTSLREAISGSVSFAIRGGPYLYYFFGYGFFVLIISVFASAFVVNIPVMGLVVGIIGGGVLGLAANITTMRFVADIDPESPDIGSWDDSEPGFAQMGMGDSS